MSIIEWCLYGGAALFALGIAVGSGLETSRRRQINNRIAAQRRARAKAR